MPRVSTPITDFSKGLDLISSPSNLEQGYTQNAINFRIAEYGGIEKVLGYSALADLGSGVAAHELFYFQKRDGGTKRLIAASSTKWQHAQADGTVTNLRTGLNAATETTFVSHEDKLYGLDRANIMASWDGTTLSTHASGVDTGPPLGIILGIWANRMWVADATNKMKIWFSAVGNFTSTGAWPTTNYIELGGPGQGDKAIGGVPTPGGLLVFTERSVYRIEDPVTGNARLIDAKRGCLSRKSLAVIEGDIYGINQYGVFALEGGNPPLRQVSRRVDPLFLAQGPDVSAAAGCAWGNSYLLSYRATGNNNNLMLEVSPSLGSIMAQQYPVTCFAVGPLASNDDRCYFIDASDTRYIRRGFNGGSFAGSEITCYYELPPDSFGDEEHLKRLQRCRLVGRGNIRVGIKTDYSRVEGDSGFLNFPTVAGGVWDTAVWDTGLWGGHELYEGWVRFNARGRRLSLRLTETSDDTYPDRDFINFSGSNQIGAAAVYLLEPHYTISSRTR